MSSVIVITGASSGIGRATASAFARQGARLALAARGREALDRVARECTSDGGEAIAIPVDVADAVAMRNLAEQTIERFGGFDVWINNAGVGAVGRYEETPIEAHRRVVETNLIGHMNGAHAALAHFRKRGAGVLINVISIGGWLSAPYTAAYTASKFGLVGLGQSLRAELSDSPDIHVCDIYPGFVDTPGVSHGANFTGRTLRPVPPLLDPERVAARILAVADRPQATVPVGGTARLGRYSRNIAPETRGRVLRRLVELALSRADATARTPGNLFEISRNHAVRGGYRQRTAWQLTAAGVLGVGVLGWLVAHRHRD